MTKQILPCESKIVINGSTYIVHSFQSENARETAEKKLVKIISQRVSQELKNAEKSLFIV